MSTTVQQGARKQRNPWVVLFGSGIAQMFGPGPLVLVTLGVFVIPITQDTGFGRTTVTGAYSVAAIGMAIGLVIVGRLLDRYAVRYILVPSFTLFCLSTALIALMPANPFAFLVPFFLLGFFGAGTFIPFTKALITWFDNKRALAIGISAGIAALGGSITPVLAGAFIGSYGWRVAYALLALIALVVSLSMIFAFVRARAERHVRGRLVTETVDDGKEVSLEQPGLTFREALKGRYFWMLTLALGAVGIAVVGLQVHLVPMMTDRGMDPAQAVLLITIFSLSGLTGRVIGGFLIDRIHGTIIGPIVIAAPVLGMFFLHPPFPSAAVAVGLIGLAYGIEGDLVAFFITRYLGTRHFGQIFGIVQSVFLIGTAFGPLLLGIAYDSTGSYDSVLPGLAVVLIVCAITIALLGRYPYPAVKGFDSVAAKDEFAAAEMLSEVAEEEDQAETRSKVVTAGGAEQAQKSSLS
ncbi:MFS transporter [Microbacterium sp. E-13]|uniref:MFS transporter n=1 Tax=Microbacterium sp. E-13 TaxID=3404048 RepID=UPI003CEFD488